MSTETVIPEVSADVPEVVPEVAKIGWKDIDGWSAQEMRKQLEDPAIREQVEAVLGTARGQQAEDEAKALADAEAAAQAAAQEERMVQEALDAEALAKAADAAALATAKEAEAAAATKAVEDAKPKKIVVEYQARDEAGNPIGRPTHLEATSWEEMSEKQKTAHIEATRALDRLKKRKENAAPKKEQVAAARMTDEEMLAIAADLKSEDVDVARVAKQKLDDDAIIAAKEEARIAKEDARQEKESYIFMRQHLADFNPCTANAEVLALYLTENKLEWNAENLEIAFASTESQLAPVPQAPAPAVPEIAPTVENTPAPATTLVPTEAPVVAAAPPAAAPNTPAAPVRRLPNGGIVPGETFRGSAPTVTKPAGITKKDIAKMSAQEMRTAMRDPAKKAEIKRALGDTSAL